MTEVFNKKETQETGVGDAQHHLFTNHIAPDPCQTWHQSLDGLVQRHGLLRVACHVDGDMLVISLAHVSTYLTRHW